MLTDKPPARKIYLDRMLLQDFGGVILAALLASVNSSLSRFHSARAIYAVRSGIPYGENLLAPYWVRCGSSSKPNGVPGLEFSSVTVGRVSSPIAHLMWQRRRMPHAKLPQQHLGREE
jgi:hypothetical protein